MKTRAELVNEVLSKLGVVSAGEDVAAEDSSRVDTKLDGIFEELADAGVVSVANFDELEDKLFDPLAEIIAARCANNFDVEVDRMNRLTQMEQLAERRLRLMGRRDPSHSVQRVDYF